MKLRQRPATIEPERYFDNWAYRIIPSTYSAFGVRTRYVIDDEKTKPARDLAIANGMSKSEATRTIKFLRREIVVDNPPSYDFQEGDLFYQTHRNAWLQIVRVVSVDGPGILEIHQPTGDNRRLAYRLSNKQLVEVLRTGSHPSDEHRIGISQSESESLRLMIV